MSEAVDRIRRRAGRDLKDVRNPGITARESIELGDHIVKLEREHDALQARVEALTGALHQAMGVLQETAFNTQLYAMHIDDEEHPWHEDHVQLNAVLNPPVSAPDDSTITTPDSPT